MWRSDNCRRSFTQSTKVRHPSVPAQAVSRGLILHWRDLSLLWWRALAAGTTSRPSEAWWKKDQLTSEHFFSSYVNSLLVKIISGFLWLTQFYKQETLGEMYHPLAFSILVWVYKSNLWRLFIASSFLSGNLGDCMYLPPYVWQPILRFDNMSCKKIFRPG